MVNTLAELAGSVRGLGHDMSESIKELVEGAKEDMNLGRTSAAIWKLIKFAEIFDAPERPPRDFQGSGQSDGN